MTKLMGTGSACAASGFVIGRSGSREAAQKTGTPLERRARGRNRENLFSCRFVIFCRLSPIHDVPERLQIIRPAILVFEVVGMFPNVAAKDRLAFATGEGLAHDRIVLVGSGNDSELAAVDDKPGPTAAEASHAGCLKLFLE